MTTVPLPVPDEHGWYRFPDGSFVRPVATPARRGRQWVAHWAPVDRQTIGALLRHEDRDGVTACVSYFHSPEAAAAALAAGGEGPGRPAPRVYAPSLADVLDGEG